MFSAPVTTTNTYNLKRRIDEKIEIVNSILEEIEATNRIIESIPRYQYEHKCKKTRTIKKKTIKDVCPRYGITPNEFSTWKKKWIDDPIMSQLHPTEKMALQAPRNRRAPTQECTLVPATTLAEEI
jgi:transposase-like protein